MPGVALVFFALAIGSLFYHRASRGIRVWLWLTASLILVGLSGWFYSPFFYALYLLIVALGFLYTAGVAIAFTITLFFITAFVGAASKEIKTANDFLALVSFLSVIPIVIALRRSYLLVQQEKRGILILESERGKSGITSLEDILSNRVNRIGILLRQPVTYLKQGLALLEGGRLTRKELPEVLRRMRKATEELFTLVKEFERGTTKNVLLSREKTFK